MRREKIWTQSKTAISFELTGAFNYFFITDDVDSDMPILQFFVLYENDKVEIEKKEQGKEKQSFNLNYS